MKLILPIVPLIHSFMLMFCASLQAQQQKKDKNISNKSGVINTTDLGADLDDEHSMVRQLVCANEFDLEGMIDATGCWKKSQSHTDMLDKIIDDYGEVYANLKVHADGFPTCMPIEELSSMYSYKILIIFHNYD